MNERPRALCLDLGKVLVDFDWTRAAEAIAARSTMSVEQATALRHNLADHPTILDYECGRISTQDFFGQMGPLLQFNGSPAELQTIWCNIFSPLPENVAAFQVAASLARTACISNTCEAHIAFVNEHYSFLADFDHRIFSFEVHAMKPDPRMYTAALDDLKEPASACLFIDDLEPNVVAARQQGFAAEQLCAGQSLVSILEQYSFPGV